MNPDRWIAGSAVAIALAALLLAVWEGCLSRHYQRLQVEPKIAVSFFYNQDGAGFIFSNAGFGPADVLWTQVLVDEEPQATWLEVGAALQFQAPPQFAFSIPANVWTAGSSGRIFWAPPGALERELREKADRIRIDSCYCSILRDCWVSSSSTTKGRYSVSSCPPEPRAFLRAPVRQ